MFNSKDYFPNDYIDKAMDYTMAGVVVAGVAFSAVALYQHVSDTNSKEQVTTSQSPTVSKQNPLQP